MVLYNVLEQARYHGLIQGDNPASKLRLSHSAKRRRICSADERRAFLAAARHHKHGWAIRLYFHLCYFTGQRPGDIVQMRWDRYNGDTVELVQQKTGKLLAVPCHRHLRWILAAAKRETNSVFIVSKHDGAQWDRGQLSELAMHKVMPEAGIEDLQVRDLRRTAVVALAEADCTESQIASVTGHEIEESRQILETYLPRNLNIARAAILKWEQNGTISLTR